MRAPTVAPARPAEAGPDAADAHEPGRGTPQEHGRGRRTWRRVVAGLAWTLSLALLGLVVLAVVVPRLTGSTPYAILTGSMQPDLPPGSLVVVRPVEPDEIGLGDVVTYQLRSGEPTVVTHRVVGVGRSTRGEVVLTTQGDANASPDAETVRGVQVRGAVRYSLPRVGRVGTLMTPDEHRLALRLSAAGLFLYAGVLLWRGRRRA